MWDEGETKFPSHLREAHEKGGQNWIAKMKEAEGTAGALLMSAHSPPLPGNPRHPHLSGRWPFQPGLTRLLTVKGIDTLGVSIADPIRASTPMFSSLMAILFLGEQITFAILCGTLLIIIGITVLSRGSLSGG